MAAPPLSLAFSSLQSTKPSLFSALSSLHLRRRVFPLPIRASSSTPITEFNITFGIPKPEVLEALRDRAGSSASTLPAHMLIPWIFRDESGNITMTPTPPADVIREMAAAKVASAKKPKSKEKPEPKAAASSQKYSKAARRYYNENIRDPQRLGKVLAEAGVASRRGSEELIFNGKVTVNGAVCKLPQTRVDTFRDSIYVNGNRLPKKLPPKLYFAVNKPKGYICSNGKESKSVVSLFDDYWKTWSKTNPGTPKPRLFTVGRLDVATIGLIIVTNDGDFAQQLAHPSSNITKEYLATIDGSVQKRHLFAISQGVELEGKYCVPDSVELMPPQSEVSKTRLRIVVHEGRNHEVRELVKNAGLKVHALKRVRIGKYRLPSDLGLGKYVELKPSDLKLFGIKPSVKA